MPYAVIYILTVEKYIRFDVYRPFIFLKAKD